MNRTYFVTGGSRGIGREIVKKLSSLGFNVVFVYQSNEEMANKLIKETNSLGIKCDVNNIKELEQASKNGKIYYGIKSYDGMISSAGISYYNTIDKSDTDDVSKVIGTNLIGTINSIKVVANDMIEAKKGNIILISSIWGTVGASCESIYSASKWGVLGLMKSTALELAPSNIRVNAISPGVILTDMSKDFTSDELEILKEKTPLGRLGKAQDISEMVAFLLSDNANFITGQNIVIDGGFTL